MKLVIELNLGNAAFEDHPEELARILSTVPGRIHNRNGNMLWDANGHVVGTVKIIERETHKGVPVKDGKFWRWRHGPFVGVTLTDAERKELGLE